MKDDSLTAHNARIFEGLLLAVSVIALWLPIIFVLLFILAGVASNGLGFVTFGDDVTDYLEYSSITGVVAVVICAVVCKPWRHRSSSRGIFGLQAVTASVVAICFIWAWCEGIEIERDRAAEEAKKQLIESHERALTAALQAANNTAVSRALQACGEYDCEVERGKGLLKAVQAGDLAMAATLLKGVTPDSYVHLGYANTAVVTVSQDGVDYPVILSSAGLITYADNRKFIDLFLPHLDADGLQQAFIGAAVGNHVDLMTFFVARGADPLRYMKLDDYGSLVGQVAGIGSVDALRWLVKRGLRIGSDMEWDDAWRNFQDWIRIAPPERRTKNIDELTDLLAQATCDPSTPSVSAQALSDAVNKSDARFARALLRHCAHANSLSDDARLKLDAMLADHSSIHGDPTQ